MYSQGERGAGDPLAIAAVGVLRQNNIQIRISGRTRFDEAIIGGIVGPVIDSSIDELMSARAIIVEGQPASGPAAGTVRVFETPARGVTLARRTAAHVALIRRLAFLIAA